MFKMLEFLFVTASLGLLAGGIDFATVEATRTLPAIYWNASNPIFSGKKGYAMGVRMGDKLDIICPMRGRNQPKEGLFYYTLYQVSEESFRNCNTVDEKRLLTCDDPTKEKKYTFLFQAITPSPWGLTFKEGEPYYFISTSDGTKSGFNIRKGGACIRRKMKLQLMVEKSGHIETDYSNADENNRDDSNHEKNIYSTSTQRAVRTKTPTNNQININSYNDNESGYHPGDDSDKSTGGSNTELVSSNGLVIGVVLGACAVLFIVLLSFLGYKVYRRRRHVKKYQSSTITSTRGPTPQTQVTLLPIGHQARIHHPHHHHHSVSSNHRLDIQDMRPPPPYNESMLDHAGSTMEV